MSVTVRCILLSRLQTSTEMAARCLRGTTAYVITLDPNGPCTLSTVRAAEELGFEVHTQPGILLNESSPAVWAQLGAALNMSADAVHHAVEPEFSEHKPGTAGLELAHASTWKRLLESGEERALILEEDASLWSMSPAQLCEAWTARPRDGHMFQLGSQLQKKLSGGCCVPWTDGESPCELWQRGFNYGFAAYILTRAGAAFWYDRLRSRTLRPWPAVTRTPSAPSPSSLVPCVALAPGQAPPPGWEGTAAEQLSYVFSVGKTSCAHECSLRGGQGGGGGQGGEAASQADGRVLCAATCDTSSQRPCACAEGAWASALCGSVLRSKLCACHAPPPQGAAALAPAAAATPALGSRRARRMERQARHLAATPRVGGRQAYLHGWLVDGEQRTYHLAMAPSAPVGDKLLEAERLPLVSEEDEEGACTMTKPQWTAWVAQCGAVAQDLTVCPSVREVRNKKYMLPRRR